MTLFTLETAGIGQNTGKAGTALPSARGSRQNGLVGYETPQTSSTDAESARLEGIGSDVEAKGWLAALTPEKRVILQGLHSTRASWNWVAALYPIAWIAASIIITLYPTWPARIVGYAVIGISIHAMAVLTHEASHYSMFRSRTWDRWVGFLMGAPVFVSHTAYRVLHGYHHKYTREEEDPDEFKNVTKSRFWLSVFFYSWLVIGTPVYLLHVSATGFLRGNWKDRFDILLEYILLVGMFGGGYALARSYQRTDIFVHCWALPMIIAMIFGNVRSWAEHTMTIPGDPLLRTRTVLSNRVVSFLMCNLNYHLEHHLCPGIPWYNLPRMHALLRDEYRRAGSFIYQSYTRFLWDAFRTGVHGVAHMPGF